MYKELILIHGCMKINKTHVQQNHYQINVQVIKVINLIKMQVQFHVLTNNVQDGLIQQTFKTVMMNVTAYLIIDNS